MKEDIIKMAREAGWKDLREFDSEMHEDFFMGKTQDLKRFAALVADRCAEIAYEAEPFHSADLIRKAFGVEK